MDAVFSDQIWLHSNCVQIEEHIALRFESASPSKPMYLRLVDAVTGLEQLEHCIVITDNVLPNQKYPLWPEYYGSFCYRPQYVDRLPTSLFACFINRACPFRQSWLYHFLRRGMLDQGLVSYRLDYYPPPQTDSDRQELFDEIFWQGNKNFLKEHQILRSKVPLRTFDVELEQAVIDSKLSIVIETYFENTGVIALSEKIFRNLLLPRPWMLFGAPNAVAHLRNVGFDVMDYLIDHRYDSIADHADRQKEILDQLESWKKITVDPITIDRMKLSCHNNYLLLETFRRALPSKVTQIINNIENF